MAMVLFALSCFGILLYLWVSFGGPTPLKPTGYRFEVQMPESALLVNEAPVRMAGLDVGQVKEKSLETQGGQTVVIEMDQDFAPIPSDSRVTLRQKSLLGQIYIEITPGSKDAPDLEDGGKLSNVNVEETVDFDEVISTFDKPTRDNFRGWIKELAQGDRERPRRGPERRVRELRRVHRGRQLGARDPGRAGSGAAPADQEHGRHARRDQPPLRRVRPVRDERERLLRRARVPQRRARRDDQHLPDVPRRVAADVRPPAASSRSTRARSCASSSRWRSSCGRRCATWASSRPTSSTSSASSSR